MSLRRQSQWYFRAALMFLLLQNGVPCGPGRINIQRTRERVPFKLRQRIPDVHETSAKASGGFNRIKRGTAAFEELKVNINPNIEFKADRGTNDNRRMTKRCERKLDNLAVLVRDYWQGKVKVKVIRAYDDGTIKVRHRRRYPFPDLHYAGRAVDITTNDNKRDKNPMLARLAYEAGFDWVSYESKGFIHASVQSEDSGTDDGSGCFHTNSTVQLKNGRRIKMKYLKIGDEVASMGSNGQLIYSPVILFFHRSLNRRTTFQIIRTQNDHHSLAITPTHYIYRVNKHTRQEAVDYAKWMSVGDQIYVRNSLASGAENLISRQVTEINRLDMVGAFAPLTEAGTIIVDDVAVSCYAVFPSEIISHWSMLPVRLIAQFYPNFFETDEEIHWYPKALLKLYQMFKR